MKENTTLTVKIRTNRERINAILKELGTLRRYDMSDDILQWCQEYIADYDPPPLDLTGMTGRDLAEHLRTLLPIEVEELMDELVRYAPLHA